LAKHLAILRISTSHQNFKSHQNPKRKLNFQTILGVRLEGWRPLRRKTWGWTRRAQMTKYHQMRSRSIALLRSCGARTLKDCLQLSIVTPLKELNLSEKHITFLHIFSQNLLVIEGSHFCKIFSKPP